MMAVLEPYFFKEEMITHGVTRKPSFSYQI